MALETRQCPFKKKKNKTENPLYKPYGKGEEYLYAKQEEKPSTILPSRMNTVIFSSRSFSMNVQNIFYKHGIIL